MKQEKSRWHASLTGTAYTYGEETISILISVYEPSYQADRQIEFRLNKNQAEGLILTLKALTER